MTEQSTANQTESVTAENIEYTLDRISLDQALRDFEIANARVIDLTQRLISANGQVVSLQAELETARTTLQELQEKHEAMQGSAAFRIASKIWALRNLVRG